jgi:hypothetical protein
MNSRTWPGVVALASVGPLVAAAVFAFVNRESARREFRASILLEAEYATEELASALVVCSDRERYEPPASQPRVLPPTSRKVPSAVPRGVWADTAVADWDDVAFRCAGFGLLPGRQRFQLQWVLDARSTASFALATGNAVAVVDVDGDGVADHLVRTEVACAKDFCEVAPRATVEVLR